jgi:hypothetical protein
VYTCTHDAWIHGLTGILVPKEIYTYLKTITIIIKINTMAHQMLNTLARHPCPGGTCYPHQQGFVTALLPCTRFKND